MAKPRRPAGMGSQEREKDARRVKRVLSQLRGSGALTPDYGAAHRIMRKLYGKKASCVYCGVRASTADHVVPQSKGGATEGGNLVPACAPCNTSKADLTPRAYFAAHPDQAARFLLFAVHVHEHLRMTVQRIADALDREKARQKS